FLALFMVSMTRSSARMGQPARGGNLVDPERGSRDDAAVGGPSGIEVWSTGRTRTAASSATPAAAKRGGSPGCSPWTPTGPAGRRRGAGRLRRRGGDGEFGRPGRPTRPGGGRRGSSGGRSGEMTTRRGPRRWRGGISDMLRASPTVLSGGELGHGTADLGEVRS